MKGTWLLPTRGRPEALARFFKAALEQGMSTPGMVLYSDPADIAGFEISEQSPWVLRRTQAEGMGSKFREIWPVVRDMDWVGWLVDDVVPMTPKWDTTLISGLNGANLISCNDGLRAPYRMCAPVFSGGWLRALGYIYPPGLFHHTYWDDALERLGRATDSWWVCMDVTLRHDDAFRTLVADETHNRSYSRMAEDKADLVKWRRTEMDGAARRIMELKARLKEPERKVANA
jgi:hypothetical protein